MEFTKENLKKLYIEEDLTRGQIAERHDEDITKQGISYHLRKHGIYKSEGKSKITKEALKRLYIEKDKSAPKIAKMFGYKSPTSIYDKLDDWNIRTKSKEESQSSRLNTLYQNKIERSGHSLEDLLEMSKNPHLSKTDIAEKLSVEGSLFRI